jgi:hypothetical protein
MSIKCHGDHRFDGSTVSLYFDIGNAIPLWGEITAAIFELGSKITAAVFELGFKITTAVFRHFQQYFSYIVTVSFIGGRNRSTLKKHQPAASVLSTPRLNGTRTYNVSSDMH